MIILAKETVRNIYMCALKYKGRVAVFNKNWKPGYKFNDLWYKWIRNDLDGSWVRVYDKIR